jgi:RNA 2',3'-cyclic 3'-phosphodiesterase
VRLFVALQISNEIREAIAALIYVLKPLDNSWKWTRAENLHVTLKFLGEISPQKLPDVMGELQSIRTKLPIPLKFKSLGFFPNERRPRVLWAGMDPPPTLPELASRIDASLAKIGIAREEREFMPHLTLARSKEGRVSPKLRETLAKHSGTEFGSMSASAFFLIESKLKSTGAEYTTLKSFSGVHEL